MSGGYKACSKPVGVCHVDKSNSKKCLTEVGNEIQTEAEIGMPFVGAGSNDIGYAFTQREAQF